MLEDTIRQPLHVAMESQMRAGNHYVLGELCVCLHARPYSIERSTGLFYPKNYSWVSEGLYHKSEKQKQAVEDTSSQNIIFQYHYYHTVPDEALPADSKTFYLIAYPFDSWYSEGLVASQTEDANSPKPSATRDNFGTYVLKAGSNEWNSFLSTIEQNAQWLDDLIDSNAFILRYEDFYVDFDNTIRRLEAYLGNFKSSFSPPSNKSLHRLYFTDEYKKKLDSESFSYLKERFRRSLACFWPEKNVLEY
jgi:hypothetical protein